MRCSILKRQKRRDKLPWQRRTTPDSDKRLEDVAKSMSPSSAEGRRRDVRLKVPAIETDKATTGRNEKSARAEEDRSSYSRDKIIAFSDSAASRVKEYLLKASKTSSGVRVSLVRTHCMGGRGYDYVLDRDTHKAGDIVFEDKGIKIMVGRTNSRYLRGLEIDYVRSFQESRLVMKNPNAIGKCRCGHHDIFS